jgi:hypothetical protein
MSGAKPSERVPQGYDGKTPWLNLLAHQQLDWLEDQVITKTKALDRFVGDILDQVFLSKTMPWPEEAEELVIEERTTVILQNGRKLVFDTSLTMKVLDSPAQIKWNVHLLSSGEMWAVPYYKTKNGHILVMRSEETVETYVMCIGTIQLGQLIPDELLAMVSKEDDVRNLREYGTKQEAYWRARDIIAVIHLAYPTIDKPQLHTNPSPT